jgi:transposase
MTKYSNELKLKAVLCILDKGSSKGAVAKQFGVAHGDIQKLVDAYKVHGIDGLTSKRFTYTQHVIEYMYANGLSARNTATIFNIAEHVTVLKWERIYSKEGPEALYRENAEKELITEVQRLRMENEYLKKLIALVQEREESAKKTKR